MKRFTTVDLARWFTGRPKSRSKGGLWGDAMEAVAGKMPQELKSSWGIPFDTGSADDGLKVLELSPAAPTVRVPLAGKANYVCVLHFSDTPPDGQPTHDTGALRAHYTLYYRDGTHRVQPIRHKFEVMSFAVGWGNWAFAAERHDMNRPTVPADVLKTGWGRLQTGVVGRGPDIPLTFWHYAMPNPDPDKPLAALEMTLTGPDPLALLAVTLFRGKGHPLRQFPRRYYRLLLPEGSRCQPSEMAVQLDMGQVLDLRAVPAWDSRLWTKSPTRGLGEPATEGRPNAFLVEMSGARDAELEVKAPRRRKQVLSYGEAFEKGKAASADGSMRLELAHPAKTWVHVTVVDKSTGKPTPTRIHFRGASGEYLPPYGHHAEVNTNWFEDCAGDLKLGGTSYAYVPGQFQIELPTGEVFVEMVKGFEYEPVRKRLTVRPGQRELSLTIDRPIDRRKEGWVTADTHVHFISPQTAWLEGQAEGLNLINLLASQWGKLFTNVADISGGPSGVSGDDTLVWVGTENRHHMLGHISMLGTHGQPVFPMCDGGPGEAWFGDADVLTLTDWARTCRQRDGVVIRPHFPTPSCEEPVYILNEVLDGAELRSFMDPDHGLDAYCFREYYRYLNCGMRVAAVGGTDKMSAGMPVGGARTYARLDPNEPFTFENWGKAVRAGRTFTTSGPLVDLVVEGRSLGEQIDLPAGGGTLEVQASATCIWPIHKLELVMNGKAVAATGSSTGQKKLSLRTRVKIGQSSWLAARCGSHHQVWHCWPIHLGAHTSPVYVQVGRKRQFSPADASYMLTLIDGGLSYLDTLSVRYDEKRHRAMKAVFEDARARIEQAMAEHTST